TRHCSSLYKAKTDGDESLRSATGPCQEKKAFPEIQSEAGNEKPQDSDGKLWEKSFTPTPDRFLYEDEEDFQEYSELGPLETTLMCVVGRAMPIHEVEETPAWSRAEGGVIGKRGGHATAQVIKALPEEEVG
ncbi:CCD83 protein, partial [Lophotis ruficrista]|nr:CCD83 protein [Lophotis ruficrista]